MPIVFEISDPRGKKVVCTTESWHLHVLNGHPEMENREEVVSNAIQNPAYSAIFQDKDYPDRNIYYLKLPNYYVKVVVTFNNHDGSGELITAFLTDSPKPGEILLWTPRSRG